MNIEEMKANREGQNLFAHLRLVGEVAREMARSAGMDSDVQNAALCAGYGHDLGKAVSWFQNWIVKGNAEDADGEKPRHHEISWAWLAERFGPDDKNELILNAIYWHHARPLDEAGQHLENNKAILAQASESDRRKIETLAAQFDWAVGFETRPFQSERAREVPGLFDPDEDNLSLFNARLLAVRTCLISADRLVSSLPIADFNKLDSGEKSVRELVDQQMGKGIVREPRLPPGYIAERFKIQQDCAADAAQNGGTVVVRAPAGFGKTIVGLLWGAKKGRRVLWVCPRNAAVDALHLTTATIEKVDYLLTWNYRHLANAVILHRLEKFLAQRGLMLPRVCTPEELGGE